MKTAKLEIIAPTKTTLLNYRMNPTILTDLDLGAALSVQVEEQQPPQQAVDPAHREVAVHVERERADITPGPGNNVHYYHNK